MVVNLSFHMINIKLRVVFFFFFTKVKESLTTDYINDISVTKVVYKKSQKVQQLYYINRLSANHLVGFSDI